MSRELERALAEEVLAEVARQRFTAKEVQQRAGIKQGSWSNYFVRCTRSIPVDVVNDVAAALGLKGSELMARAEERVGLGDVHQQRAEQILAQMSPEAAESLRRYLAGREPGAAQEDDTNIPDNGMGGSVSALKR